ncbi:MAG: ABC transporter permease [Rhodospirillales bacterium]|nr:ABC transporter permease [Rhodospirillales bacterium]
MQAETKDLLIRIAWRSFYVLTALVVAAIIYGLSILNYGVIFKYFGKVLGGAVITLELVTIAVILGFFVALPTALMRLSPNPLLRYPAHTFIYFFRGTPLLIQMFFVYYGFAQTDIVRETFLWPIFKQAYWCALFTFVLNTGAYSAEILRGAIQAVPAGEIEAARAFGMSKWTAYRRVILPRAFRIAMPAYGNEIIFMLKGTALASTITLLDLTGVARTVIARTFTSIDVFLVAGLIYVAITYCFLWGWSRIEKRVNAYLSQQP